MFTERQRTQRTTPRTIPSNFEEKNVIPLHRNPSAIIVTSGSLRLEPVLPASDPLVPIWQNFWFPTVGRLYSRFLGTFLLHACNPCFLAFGTFPASEPVVPILENSTFPLVGKMYDRFLGNLAPPSCNL